MLTQMATTNPLFSLQTSPEIYTSTDGIQLALGSKLHERRLLNLRGSVAVECMDKMLLVSTPITSLHSNLDVEGDSRC